MIFCLQFLDNKILQIAHSMDNSSFADHDVIDEDTANSNSTPLYLCAFLAVVSIPCLVLIYYLGNKDNWNIWQL